MPWLLSYDQKIISDCYMITVDLRYIQFKSEKTLTFCLSACLSVHSSHFGLIVGGMAAVAERYIVHNRFYFYK